LDTKTFYIPSPWTSPSSISVCLIFLDHPLYPIHFYQIFTQTKVKFVFSNISPITSIYTITNPVHSIHLFHSQNPKHSFTPMAYFSIFYLVYTFLLLTNLLYYQHIPIHPTEQQALYTVLKSINPGDLCLVPPPGVVCDYSFNFHDDIYTKITCS